MNTPLKQFDKMEVENESTFQHDETGIDESLNQTGFLLQRLKELQAWQQDQEIQLLREQELQIGRLCNTNNEVNCIGRNIAELTQYHF